MVLKSLIAGALFVSAVSVADAQVYVRVRPAAPRVVIARPPAPSPRHVWVAEDWRAHNRGYRWQGGYWAAPPRPRAVWVPGHWEGRRRGNVWIPGYWR